MCDRSTDVAIEKLSLKFLQYIWESTCRNANSSTNNLNRFLEFIKLKNNSSMSNCSIETRKRKSILIQPFSGLNIFNKGTHLFKIKDLIIKFCEQKNHEAIK